MNSTPAPRRFRTLNARNFGARCDELFAKNHLDANASFDGCMFETFGAEVEFVRETAEKHPDRVATILDCDGKLYLSRGFHFVNRHGYLVAKADLPEFNDFRV